MKKLIILLLLFIPVLSKDKPKEFNITVTLNFKGMTLEQATKLEKKLLSSFSDTLDYSLTLSTPKVEKGWIKIQCDSLEVLPRLQVPPYTLPYSW